MKRQRIEHFNCSVASVGLLLLPVLHGPIALKIALSLGDAMRPAAKSVMAAGER